MQQKQCLKLAKVRPLKNPKKFKWRATILGAIANLRLKIVMDRYENTTITTLTKVLRLAQH